jgi:hypothetical protein
MFIEYLSGVKMSNRSNFLFPRSRYYGSVCPENLVFNANLQEFSQRIGLICGLQTSGKLSASESFEQVQTLWQQLERSGHELGFDRLPEDS